MSAPTSQSTATPTPTPPPLDQLRDELDLLLVDYLQAIEHYQQSRHRLETQLRSGFFDLARAKLALGPANVGPAKYDLTEHASHKVVRITPNEKEKDTTANAPSWSFALADRPDNDEDDEDDDDDDDDDTDSEQLHPTLRHRVRTTTRSRSRSNTSPPDTAVTHAAGASSPTEKQQRPPPPPPPPSPPRPSPLTQFAALPPPALRASAAAFTQAVQVAVGIVDAEARVRDCARRIKRARKGIDRRRDEEGELASSTLSQD